MIKIITQPVKIHIVFFCRSNIGELMLFNGILLKNDTENYIKLCQNEIIDILDKNRLQKACKTIIKTYKKKYFVFF